MMQQWNSTYANKYMPGIKEGNWKISKKSRTDIKLRINEKRRKKKIRWEPPPENWVKINFDGSVLQDGATAWGFVIRNGQGIVIHSGVEVGKDIPPVLAEAFALRLAVTEAVRLGFGSV